MSSREEEIPKAFGPGASLEIFDMRVDGPWAEALGGRPYLDRYVYRVPMLRNVAKTAPYFHDGSAAQIGHAAARQAPDDRGTRRSRSARGTARRSWPSSSSRASRSVRSASTRARERSGSRASAAERSGGVAPHGVGAGAQEAVDMVADILGASR